MEKHPALRSTLVDTMKSVENLLAVVFTSRAISERGKKLQDTGPVSLIADFCNKSAVFESGLGRSVIGSEADVKLSRGALQLLTLNGHAVRNRPRSDVSFVVGSQVAAPTTRTGIVLR